MDQLFNNGCNWIVGTSTRGVGPTKTVHHVFCNKLCEEGSSLCPKHTLFREDEAQEPLRQAQARVANRKFRQERLEALAASPLAAVNPRFDTKPKDHGGMDATEAENKRPNRQVP